MYVQTILLKLYTEKEVLQSEFNSILLALEIN